MTSHSRSQAPKSRPLAYPVSAGDDVSNCDKAITPACLAALYKFPPADKADPSNAMGLFENGDFYDQEDLDLFFRNFTPHIPQGTHPAPAPIDGAIVPVPLNQSGGESLLDFELAYPILWPQTTVLYQTDDINYSTELAPNSGGFNTFLDAIDGSYCTYSAFGETGDDPTLDPTYPDTLLDGYNGTLQCGVYKPTNVISVSYGGQEYDLPAYYQQRQCNE
jgi:tripeptidyl-peptidase-1